MGYINMLEWAFLHQAFVFVLLFLCRVCKHVRLGILAARICYFVCVGVEGMYKCEAGNFDNKPLCSHLCCCRGYVQM